jgi:TRAP-type C4-dicarboxylate transport system substrate-binding protein
MSKRRFSTLCAAALVATLTVHDARSEDAVTIRVGTLAPEGSPWHDVLLEMNEAWRKISGGKVTLKIYSGVLGDEAEMIRKMNRRQLQAVAISGAALPSIERGVSCFQIPMMLDSYEELDYVLERIGPRLEKKFAERGYVVLNWSDAGWVHFFSKKPVATPGDLRKTKLLTSAGDPETEALYKDFGFHVVPLPYTDVLVSLETGLIESVQGPPLYAMLDQWFGLATNMTDLRWSPLIGATLIREDVWNGIPEPWRAPMLEASRQAGLRLRATIRKLGDDAVHEMQKRGLNVVSLDAAQVQAWRSEARAAYPKLRGKYAPAELFDEVLRLRDEFRARSGAGATPE